MTPSGIVAIVENGLYVLAIKQVSQALNSSESLEFWQTLDACYNQNCYPKTVIIQNELLTSPAAYTLERLKTKVPKTKIIVLNAEKLEQQAHAYCDALIASTTTEDEILKKLTHIFSSTSNSDNNEQSDTTLSERETEVVRLVALGKTNKEISDELFISTHTVITHRKNITNKLGIKTIAGLAVFAVLNGIVDPEEVNQ